MKTALIFANGKAKNGAMVRRALEQADTPLIIAADGGARIAWRYHLTPHTVIGDMDSLSPDELVRLRVQGADIQQHPPEKNETDLELALLFAAEQAVNWIRIIGAIGGRFDQMLANVYLLALPQLAMIDVAVVAGRQYICLLPVGQHDIHGTQGDTISLVPISGDVHGITTQALKYPLNNDTLRFGPARGVSNVMLSAQATVSVGEGMLLCIHTIGRA